jgi:hypothetical protein
VKDHLHLNDPARTLAHASLYLWKSWHLYALTAWEDAESILRHAYDAVQEEDRIEFIRGLDEFFAEKSSIQSAGAGADPAVLERL